jgi:hypothetical protein
MKRNFQWPLLLGGVLATCTAQAIEAGAAPALDQALSAMSAAQAFDFVGHASFRVRNEAEFERMKEYLRQHYAGVVATHFFELEPGTIVDCVDELTQPGAHRLGLTRATWVREPSQRPADVPGRLAGQPPSNIDYRVRDRGVFLRDAQAGGAVEFDASGRVKSCAEGTIPKLRLDLERLAMFETLEHFRHKLGQPGLSPLRSDTAADRAARSASLATVYEYAHAQQGVLNRGAESTLNVWKSYTEKISEHSLSQIWVVRGSDSELQTIETGWQVSRSRHIFNPKDPYLFIFSTQDGYGSTGCYDLECNDFVQTSSSLTVGARLTSQSQTNGPQYIHTLTVWKDGPKSGSDTLGHWWIAVDGEWLGYYPRSLYSSSGIRDDATVVDFGGEIVNTWPHDRHTMTDMGSGAKPSAGWQHAAYQRTIRSIDIDGYYQTPTLYEDRDNAACYDIDTFYATGDWQTYFYFGGEGLNTATCP